MSKLTDELASLISLEQRVDFTMHQPHGFQSQVIGVSMEQIELMDEETIKEMITNAMKVIPSAELFKIISLDMLGEYLNNKKGSMENDNRMQ